MSGVVVIAVLLGLTAVSWTAFGLYERREARREQQQEEAQP